MFALTKAAKHRAMTKAKLQAELAATTPAMLTVYLYDTYLEVVKRDEDTVTYTVYDVAMGYTEDYDFTVRADATGGEVLEAYYLFNPHPNF